MAACYVQITKKIYSNHLRDGDFADFSAFADFFFSVLPIFRISADFCSFEPSALSAL